MWMKGEKSIALFDLYSGAKGRGRRKSEEAELGFRDLRGPTAGLEGVSRITQGFTFFVVYLDCVELFPLIKLCLFGRRWKKCLRIALESLQQFPCFSSSLFFDTHHSRKGQLKLTVEMSPFQISDLMKMEELPVIRIERTNEENQRRKGRMEAGRRSSLHLPSEQNVDTLSEGWQIK